MRYSFFFEGGLDNIYAFETVLEISYEVKFRPQLTCLETKQLYMQIIFTNL